MLDEQRDQQSMDLFTSTSTVLRDRIMRHYGTAAQESLWPNRWERIGTRALEKDAVFNNLLVHINVETLREGFQALDGTKAQGIDGMTKEQCGRNLSENLADLARRIHEGSYKPQDKRPYVVEIDFESFFNTIPHKGIMKALRKRISDNRFEGLVGRFLKGGILEQSGQTTTPTVGTPQGGIMSPILANIYLNEAVDQWFVESYASYSNIIVRYADDAVFLFKKKEEAEAFLKDLELRVVRFGLSLNMAKSRTVDFRKSENNDIDFLGFTFYWGEKKKFRPRPLKMKTSKKSLHKSMQAFEQWIKENRSAVKLQALWELAATKLAGHYNYFGLWTNGPKLRHFYSEALRSLFKWLNRRSQKRSYSWEAFLQRVAYFPLPVPPSTAELKCFGRPMYAHA